MPIKRIGNYGKRWKLKVVPHIREKKGWVAWGFCDYANREISISKKAEKEGIGRETVIHEVIHKLCPFLHEDCVDKMATELDDVLDLLDL